MFFSWLILVTFVWTMWFPPSAKVTAVFHYPCLDGASAAAMIAEHIGAEPTFVGWQHGAHDKAMEEITKSKPDDIYFVDCCPSKEQVQTLLKSLPLANILVLDHHVAACDKLTEYVQTERLGGQVEVHTSLKVRNKPVQSGVGIVASYFRVPMSTMFKAIQAWDIWHFSDMKQKRVYKELLVGMFLGHTCLIEGSSGTHYPVTNIQDLSPSQLVNYLSAFQTDDYTMLNRVYNKGQAEYKRQEEASIELATKKMKWFTVGGKQVAMVPSPRTVQDGVSEVLTEGQSMVIEYIRDQYPFLSYIIMVAPKSDGLIGLSLRQISDEVLPIAEQLGGGGHKAAAGCSIHISPNALAQTMADEGDARYMDLMNMPRWDEQAIWAIFGGNYVPFYLIAKTVAERMDDELPK